jgi:hypothetical protein
MARPQIKTLGKSGRVSRTKARAVAKSLKAKFASSKKATPKKITNKQTASGKGLITFRVEKISQDPSSHLANKKSLFPPFPKGKWVDIIATLRSGYPRPGWMARLRPYFSESVFINCPFDQPYWPIFEGIVFCIIHCGFVPRSALEEPGSGQLRLEKIRQLIRQSQYAIHDLSRVEISTESALPRFNMPFELGLDLGCQAYGRGHLRTKKCLILEAEPHRYQAAISDIAGLDIKCHHNSPDEAITVVRNWLRGASRQSNLPGPSAIRGQFFAFTTALPESCDSLGLDRHDLQFVEYMALAQEWLAVGNSP